MVSTKVDLARMTSMLESDILDRRNIWISTLFDPEIPEMSEENPPVEDEMPTEEDPVENALPIKELQTMLEEMQCLGYEGAQGVEDQLCVVCDEILSMLPAMPLLDTVAWCSAPM